MEVKENFYREDRDYPRKKQRKYGANSEWGERKQDGKRDGKRNYRKKEDTYKYSRKKKSSYNNGYHNNRNNNGKEGKKEEDYSPKRKMIVLIGMPGAGKSTVGIVLAKRMGWKFLDSDLVIQDKTGKLLHELIDAYGNDGFLQIENDVNKEILEKHTVVATGGSAVYGEEAMEHFKKNATIVYLKLSYKEIKRRLGDLHKRGVAIGEGQTLKDLYDERCKLYEKYADITIYGDHRIFREVVRETLKQLKKLGIRPKQTTPSNR